MPTPSIAIDEVGSKKRFYRRKRERKNSRPVRRLHFFENTLSKMLDKSYLLGEFFCRRGKAEDLTRICIYPIFNELYLLIGITGYVRTLRQVTSYFTIQSLVCTTFTRRVRMAIIHARPLSAIYGLFQAVKI